MTLQRVKLGISTVLIDNGLNKLAPENILASIRQLLKKNEDLLGSYQECKMVEDREVGQSLSFRQYNLVFEKQVLNLSFFLFKPRGTWEVSNFRFAYAA